MAIKHKKQSGVNDNGVSAQVQPSNWNDEHDVDGLLGALINLAATPGHVPYVDGSGNGAAFPISDFARTVIMTLTSSAQMKADLGLVGIDSPAFTGVPTGPTAAFGENSNMLANTEFVQAAIAALVDTAPGALDTLNELAAALGDDPNFATTVTNALALKAPLASPALTGTPTAPTVAGTADSTTKIATTAFVQAVAALLAPKASPTFTGTVTVPTPANGDNSTKAASTAYVQASAGGATATPIADAYTGAVGVATKAAREDHVHPRVVSVPDVLLEEQQASGTHGGTATAGSWIQRVLNVVPRNVGGFCTLSANRFTLLAGTYFIEWDTPAYFCDRYKSQLWNVTDGATAIWGTSEFSAKTGVTDAPQTNSRGSGFVTIAASKAFEIQLRVTTTAGTAGLGQAASFGTEIYTRVKITKVSP